MRWQTVLTFIIILVSMMATGVALVFAKIGFDREWYKAGTEMALVMIGVGALGILTVMLWIALISMFSSPHRPNDVLK